MTAHHTSSVIAAAGSAVALGDLSVAGGVSSTHLAQRFKELIGVTSKRYRFAATVFAINLAGLIDWGDLTDGAATSTKPTSASSSGRSPG
jgi:hypothetical protein